MRRNLPIPLSVWLLATCATALASPRPNIILAMADDMGWGDPSHQSITVQFPNGTPHPNQGWIQTPTLDAMVGNGLRFTRFYAASPVCSPTRGSCLTGRDPLRLGIPNANAGRLRFDETPLSKVLSAHGYRCGHFGKWHLGSLTTLRADSNRGGNASVYSAPWHHGYHTCFVTESKVPTHHPYRKPVNGLPLPTSFSDPNFYGTYYWRMPTTWNTTSGEGSIVPIAEVNHPENGDDSKLLVDQVIPFIRDAVANDQPFFVVLWFHTPHREMVDPAGVGAINSNVALKASIEGLDLAMGRLRDELETLSVRGNTMLWFTSDNGPENNDDSPNETNTVRSIRSGRYLERKRSLHEGGVRVPGILEWPDVIGETGRVTAFPAVTSDYYPTILDYLELTVPGQKPLDGISLRPVLENDATTRTKPIGFRYGNAKSWVNQQYKLIDDNGTWELYDLINIAPGQEVEQTPLATSANIGSRPQAVRDVYHTMLAEYDRWAATLASDTPYIHPSQPTVTLTTPEGAVTAPFTVTATFSEPVSQLHANEFVATNGSASNLAGGGTTWTVTITPTAEGNVTVSLPEGAVINQDGNINAASNQLQTLYTLVGVPPGATLSGPDQTTDAYTVNATFTRSVEGLTAEDFSVTNGSASGVSGAGSAYTLTITPAAPGLVSVFLPAGAVTGLLDGLENTASNTLTTNYVPQPPGASLFNGDLNTPVVTSGSSSGTAVYSLNTTTSKVMRDGSVDTGIVAGQWLRTSLTRGFQYDANGGAGGTGDGAFVPTTHSDAFNQRIRGVIQFATDGKATTGTRTISMDVFMADNTPANALTLLVEWYAWNGPLSPGLSVGGGIPNEATYNVTNLNGAATLLNTTIAATSVPHQTWQTVSLGTVDLGSGYDHYVWRIGVFGQTDGDVFKFDNLSVTSPTPEEFRITSFTLIDQESDHWQVALVGAATTPYVFRSSANLDFPSGTLIENLSPGVPAFGTIGGPHNRIVTTDANGNATVRMTLTGNPSDFVRAESAP